MVGFSTSALRASVEKPTKCAPIPAHFFFSKKGVTSIYTAEIFRKIKKLFDPHSSK